MASIETPPSLPQPPPPLTDAQKRTVVLPTEPWDDQRAYNVAWHDFTKAEAHLQQQHFRRWTDSDRLSLAFRTSRTWEGTRIPRAAIPVYHALSLIESMLAQVIGAIFTDNFDFDTTPRAGTTVEQARAVKQLLLNQLIDLDPERSFLTMRELFRRAFKSGNWYGNGIIEFGWLLKNSERSVYRRELLPERRPFVDPASGQELLVPTGNFFERVTRDIERSTISRPLLQNIDIRDFFIDPNCASNMVQDAAFCGTRTYRTIGEMLQFADTPDFNVPSQAELVMLSDAKTSREAESAKARTETYRGGNWQPSQDTSLDALSHRVEVIRYWNQDRHIWLIKGWNKPIFNQPNELRQMPFLNVGFIDVPGRFYQLSMCDLVEGDQKLIETILDARIDELNLMIHSPIVRRRKAVITGTQRRMRPGVEWEVEGDPSKDIVRMEMGNVTAQAFAEVDLADRRSQKATGVTDLASMGVPSGGGNSAARTATGVNTQSAATGRRMEYHVMNIEEQVIIPMLNVVLALDQRYLDPIQMVELAGPNGQSIEIDPLDILNASVRFQFKASSKLRARNALLAGGGLPLIFESLMSPQLVDGLAQFGYKPNVVEAFNLVADVFSLPHTALYVQMSPEEQQQYFQQKMAPDMVRMQMQRERIAGQAANDEEKMDAQLIQSLITSLLKHPEIAATVMEEFGLDAPKKMLDKKNEKPPAAPKKPAAKGK